MANIARHSSIGGEERLIGADRVYVLLASDEAGYLSGAVIAVTGGKPNL